MGRVLVVGESLVDVVHRVDGTVERHPGGSPLNVAVGLARLGHDVSFATRFAADSDGCLIRDYLAGEPRLRLTSASDRATRTSVAEAYLDLTGAARYLFDLNWDVADALDEQPVGHLHTGSIAATLSPGAEDVLRLARRVADEGTISYDPNMRPSIMGEADRVRGRVVEMVGLSDVVKASDEDVDWLYPARTVEQVVADWARLGPSLIVITRGSAGAAALVTTTGEQVLIPPGTSAVVDTVGAGDSFMSGLLAGLLDLGLLGDAAARRRLRAARLTDLRPALVLAATCAAITVSRAGANPPTWAEVA